MGRLRASFPSTVELPMTTSDSPTEPLPLPSGRRARHFSLRALFLVMTAVSLWCGFATVLPGVLSHLLLGGLWLGITGWLLTGLVFARGDTRAFCLGAAVVVSSTWTGMGGQFLEAFRTLGSLLTHGMGLPYSEGIASLLLWFKHFALLATAIANGWLCIRARRYFEGRMVD